MDNNNKHIDDIIREKFAAFAPTPPPHVWAGIEKGVSAKPVVFFNTSIKFISAATLIILALLSSIYFFTPFFDDTSLNGSTQNISDINTPLITENNNITSADENSSEVTIQEEVITETIVDEPTISETKDHKVIAEVQYSDPVKVNSEELIENRKESTTKIESNNSFAYTDLSLQYETDNSKLSIITLRKSIFICPDIGSNLLSNANISDRNSLPQISVPNPVNEGSNSHWKIGYYLSPELSISDFDSVQILNSYTLSVEPSYTINDHWFFRFGVGLSYVRDRGFANISYITNEYMGSYDDVYEITFDTISGNIVPVYHTKTVEIWDTVQHVSVSDVTNKYLYLQIPALFGYYNKKAGSKIGWYLFGGPAFNLKVGSWIDDPKPDEKDADIIDLQNNLPKRSGSYMQLWLGAGIEYEINRKLSMAFEPGYRYYFKSIYSSPYSPTSSSGFSLRIGLVYKLK